MESNSLDCNKMYNFYKSCLLKNLNNSKINCKVFTKTYLKKCNNFIEYENFNKLTYNDYN